MLKAIAIFENGGGGGGGVTSINGETGAVSLTSTGGTIAITTPTGSTINIEAASGGGTVTTTGSPASGNLTKFSGTSSITNGDLSGDVTTSGTLATTIAANAVTTGKINNAAVTYAKIQNESAVTLLGNPTGGAQAPSEITLGSGLSFSGTTLTASGAVSSVSNADGTLTISPTTGAVVASIATSAALPGSPTTTTQAATDNSTKVATTSYVTTAVNNAIAGVNPAVAVQVATTQASDTSSLTYNNGASGIGATFTGTTNTALTFDGVTLTSLAQRVLVKNDTQSPSGAFNGIYTLTQLQTSLLPPILTRALDYDQPSDINNTGAIPVISGTANGGTSWVQTAQIVTVGTTPLAFTQFTLSPTTLVTLTGTQTLTNKRITKRVVTAADATSVTPNSDNADWTYQSNSQATGTLTINADTGSPTNAQAWGFKIKSTNVQTFSWNTVYAGGAVALPTTSTGGGKIDYYTFIYDTVNSKWDFTGNALGF